MSGYVHIDIDIVPQMQRDKLRKVAKKCGIKISTHHKNEDLRKEITKFYNEQKKKFKIDETNKENVTPNVEEELSSSSESMDDHTSPTPVKTKSKMMMPPPSRGRKRNHADSSESPYNKKSSRKKYRSSSSEDDRKKHKSDKRHDDPFKEYCKRYNPSKPNEDDINWKKILKERMDAEHALTTKYRDELFDSKLYDSYKKVRTDLPAIIKLLSDSKSQIETAKYVKEIRHDLEEYISKNKDLKDSNYREKFYKLENNIVHQTISLNSQATNDDWIEKYFQVKCIFYSVTSGLPALISLDFNFRRKSRGNEEVTLKLRWLKEEDRLDLSKEKYQVELAKFLLDSKIEDSDVSICMDFIVHALLPKIEVGWITSRLSGLKESKRDKKDTKQGSDCD